MMRPILSTVAAAALILSSAGPALAAPGAHGGGAGGAHADGPVNPPASPAASTGTATDTSATTSTGAALRGPAQTGQPNQSCGSATAPNTPGNAASAPGSAFNPDGTAGGKYAGQQPQNSNNTASVSQYDAACAHQPK